MIESVFENINLTIDFYPSIIYGRERDVVYMHACTRSCCNCNVVIEGVVISSDAPGRLSFHLLPQ